MTQKREMLGTLHMCQIISQNLQKGRVKRKRQARKVSTGEQRNKSGNAKSNSIFKLNLIQEVPKGASKKFWDE